MKLAPTCLEKNVAQAKCRSYVILLYAEYSGNQLLSRVAVPEDTAILELPHVAEGLIETCCRKILIQLTEIEINDL